MPLNPDKTEELPEETLDELSGDDMIPLRERLIAHALSAILRQNINEDTPSSGVVIRFGEDDPEPDEVYVVRFCGISNQLILTQHQESDDPVRNLPDGAFVSMHLTPEVTH